MVIVYRKCSAPSQYLDQCWNIVNWTLRNKIQWSINHNSYIFIQVKYQSQFIYFHSRKCIWKCHLQNGGHVLKNCHVLKNWHRAATQHYHYIDSSVQNCSNSIANALELLQSCTKPSIYNIRYMSFSLVSSVLTMCSYKAHTMCIFCQLSRQYKTFH